LRQRDEVEVIELNIQADHVPLWLWIPPKYAVSEIMGFLKGKLALRLFERFPQLGRKYWGRHLWSRGYCVSTVGIDEEMIRQYVRWQESQERRDEQQQGKLFDE
jgi:putative transposase